MIVEDTWPEGLRDLPILPDAGMPHAFERHTAAMLRTAFGLGDRCESAQSKPSLQLPKRKGSRIASIASAPSLLLLGALRDSAPKARSPRGERAVSLEALQELLASSTTMFLMQKGFQHDDIEHFARSLFSQLVGGGPVDVLDPAGGALPATPFARHMTMDASAHRTFRTTPLDYAIP